MIVFQICELKRVRGGLTFSDITVQNGPEADADTARILQGMRRNVNDVRREGSSRSF